MLNVYCIIMHAFKITMLHFSTQFATKPLINAHKNTSSRTRLPTQTLMHKYRLLSASASTHLHNHKSATTASSTHTLFWQSSCWTQASGGISSLTQSRDALDDIGLFSSHKLEPDCQWMRRRHTAFPTEIQMCTNNNERKFILVFLSVQEKPVIVIFLCLGMGEDVHSCRSGPQSSAYLGEIV